MVVGNFLAAFEDIHEHWSPRVIGRVNDQYLKAAKVLGSLTWHQHDDEDELFYVLKGQLVIEYRDRPAVVLAAGDFHVVPKATQHNPVAAEECWIVLIETVTTRHTGDVIVPQTKTVEQQLA